MAKKINTFIPGLIQAVREKTAGVHVALCGNFSGKRYGPSKRLKRLKSCTLHSKKKFRLGLRIFCEWRHK